MSRPPGTAVPTSLAVPAHARSLWVALNDAATDAPCRFDPDLWTGKPSDQDYAARLCSSCPALALCDQYATLAGERSGVWGGRTETDRKQTRHERTA